MGLIKGSIRNHSSKTLWGVETDSGPAKAQKLGSNMKSPFNIDVDGAKTIDGTLIDGHKSWWKINSLANADIYDDKPNNQLAIKSRFKSKVNEDEFGQVEYLHGFGWGEKISSVISVRKNRKGSITKFYIDNGIGWIDKSKAIEFAKKGQIEAVVVNPRNNDPYIRSRPDNTEKNNFSNLYKN